MAYIDNQKAFESVETSAVMKAPRKQGVEEIIIYDDI